MKSEGKFIVLDGTDGAGKTVQLELLRKKLSEQDFNFSVLDFFLKFPWLPPSFFHKYGPRRR